MFLTSLNIFALGGNTSLFLFQPHLSNSDHMSGFLYVAMPCCVFLVWLPVCFHWVYTGLGSVSAFCLWQLGDILPIHSLCLALNKTCESALGFSFFFPVFQIVIFALFWFSSLWLVFGKQCCETDQRMFERRQCSINTSWHMGLFSGLISWVWRALQWMVSWGLDLRWLKNVSALIWMLIVSEYLPNSVWQTFVGVLLCVCKMYIENSACRDFNECLSQWVELWWLNKPHTLLT